MWASLNSQLIVAVVIGFGLALGVALFFAFIKYAGSFIEWTVLKFMKFKRFSNKSKELDNVWFLGKKYYVTRIIPESTVNTYFLVGIGHKDRVSISLPKPVK